MLLHNKLCLRGPLPGLVLVVKQHKPSTQAHCHPFNHRTKFRLKCINCGSVTPNELQNTDDLPEARAEYIGLTSQGGGLESADRIRPLWPAEGGPLDTVHHWIPISTRRPSRRRRSPSISAACQTSRSPTDREDVKLRLGLRLVSKLVELVLAK